MKMKTMERNTTFTIPVSSQVSPFPLPLPPPPHTHTHTPRLLSELVSFGDLSHKTISRREKHFLFQASVARSMRCWICFSSYNCSIILIYSKPPPPALSLFTLGLQPKWLGSKTRGDVVPWVRSSWPLSAERLSLDEVTRLWLLLTTERGRQFKIGRCPCQHSYTQDTELHTSRGHKNMRIDN